MRLLWLQQLGRGLRKLEGKTLKVIDYIGNHRVFLVKVRALLELGAGGGDPAIAAALAQVTQGERMPTGSVTYELRTLEILRGLLRQTGAANALREYYVDFRERIGARPTAVEAYHDQYAPRSMHAEHGSWLEFVREMGDLDEAQIAAIELARGHLRAFEKTRMVKSYKMLVAKALLEADALPGPGLHIDELVRRVREIAGRNPKLANELAGARTDRELRRLLETNPIDAWCGGRGQEGGPSFEYEGEVFRLKLAVPDSARAALAGLVSEIVEWRLAEYLNEGAEAQAAGAFTMKVSQAGGRPMMFLPDRAYTHSSRRAGRGCSRTARSMRLTS